MSCPEDSRRLDTWLFFARFFKSRTLAGQAIERGRLRINTVVVKKTHYRIRVGDVVTLPVGGRICVIRVLSIGERRGPASEARTLYETLAGDD